MTTASLKGRTVLVTRARPQASIFTAALEDLGARVIEIPTIEIIPVRSEALDASIKTLERYDWIFFTSANSAAIFFERMLELLPGGGQIMPKICAIGPATAEKIREYGRTVDLLPELFQAEGMIDEFSAAYGNQLSGVRILLPRAKLARAILPEQLRQLGADVDVIPIYETVVPTESAKKLKSALQDTRPDLIAFTSSSTVRNFVALASGREILADYDYAAIGPITAKTAEEQGLRVVLQPKRSTIPDFVDAIRYYFTFGRIHGTRESTHR